MEYAYRSVEIDGHLVKLPRELLPQHEPQTRRRGSAELAAHLRERRHWWITWQKLGLPLPDPDTGRCGFLPGRSGAGVAA